MGEITEKGSGYTFFWSGKTMAKAREIGVGFAIRKPEVLPRGINDWLMVM